MQESAAVVLSGPRVGAVGLWLMPTLSLEGNLTFLLMIRNAGCLKRKPLAF